MSYIVLARKWRPQGFDDLTGQETVVTTLRNALSSDKIVHAYLFSGPRGVGKTSSARILAKALNCRERQDSDPCNQCQSCREITGGSSVDVFEIDGASNTSVDSVRELRETVKYAPAGGKYKIYIIDEVHMLSTPAFNALLKTLEEPPAHVIFIFATTEPKKIPPTILSRCQHHAFRRISRRLIKEQLQRIADTENIHIKDSAIDMIARGADGSMRDALTLLDQASSFSADITEGELETLLGLPESDIILNLSETILKGDIARTLSIIKELTERGGDLRQLTRELVEHFRNIAMVKITEDARGLLEFTEDEVERLRSHSSGVSIEELTLLLTELLRLEGEVRSAISPRYTLELGLLRMSFIKGMTSIDSVLKMMGSEKADLPAPAEKKTADAIKDNNTVSGLDPADSNVVWKKLLERLDAQDNLLAAKLAAAKVIRFDSQEIAIGFNGGMSVLADSIEKSASVIKPILRELSGRNLRLKILSLPSNSQKKNIKDVREEVFSDPMVKDALKRFQGSLLKVKPLEDEDGSSE